MCNSLEYTAFCALIITGALCRPQPAMSQDYGFIPGDAFFRSALTAELISRIQHETDRQAMALEYRREHIAHKTAGYVRIEISAASLARRKLLLAAYREIRRDIPPIFEITTESGNEVRRELNGPELLLYNNSFDFRQYNIGLRYNESFFTEAGKLYVTLNRAAPYYLRGPSLKMFVVEDWRNSPQVEALKVTLPHFHGKLPRELQHTPMAATSSDLMFIIIESGGIEAVCAGSELKTFYIVGEQELLRVDRQDREWHSRELAVPKGTGTQ
jgi:hypothetical protein